MNGEQEAVISFGRNNMILPHLTVAVAVVVAVAVAVAVTFLALR